MTEFHDAGRLPCPGCSAPLFRYHEKCWTCGIPVHFTEDGKLVEARPQVASPKRRLQFGLQGLLQLVLLYSLVALLIVELPCPGIVAAILSLPALVRTYRILRREEAEGGQSGWADSTLLFISSFGVVGVIVAIAGATFVGIIALFVWLWRGQHVGGIDLTVFLIAAGLGLLAGSFAAKALWPAGDPPDWK